MRNKIILISGLLLLAVMLAGCSPAAAQTTPPNPRTLSVTGSGQVILDPDIAYLHIGVQTEGPDAAEAVADNNAQVQAVIEVIKGLGVQDRDIQTTNFSIYPQQEYEEGRVIGTRYIVDNTVYVTVRNLEQVGGLLDAVVSAGANSIRGIQFDVADKVAALSAARQAAVENARAQAEELASATGVVLGSVQTINAYGGFPPPVFSGRGFALDVAAAEAPISPGQLTVSVEVNIVYEIR